MLRTLAVGLSLLSGVSSAIAGPPASKPSAMPTRVVRAAAQESTQPKTPTVVHAGTPVVVQQAPTPIPAQPAPVVVQHAPGTVVQQPCNDCNRAVRSGRIWMIDRRPIVIDCKDRYEPRIRDIRFAPASSTLPGTGLGAPDTLFVLPPYRDGYIRLFETR